MVPLTLATANVAELLGSSTAPIILISGIGLLLLVMSGRILHVSDRLRSIMQMDFTTRRGKQVDVLHHRARMLRVAIVALCSSIFSSGILLVLNVIGDMGLFRVGDLIIGTLLILSTVGIAIASGGLLYDVIWSLRAVEVEIEQYTEEKKTGKTPSA